MHFLIVVVFLTQTSLNLIQAAKFIKNKKITKCKQIKLNVKLYNDLAACMHACVLSVIKLEILMTFVVSRISSKVKV